MRETREEIETWLIAPKNAAARKTSTQLEMEFQSPPPTSAAHPASGSTGGSLTQSEMLAELHAGRNSQLHHSQSLVLDVDEGLESLRLQASARREPRRGRIRRSPFAAVSARECPRVDRA